MKLNFLIIALVLVVALFTSVEGRNLRKNKSKKSHSKFHLNAKSLLQMLTSDAEKVQPGKGVIMYEIPGHTDVTDLNKVMSK